ncbi:MAG: peptide chain release factor 2 [Candidatus Magasanikbacteria bacterium]|nr:peptide chain release factor 2 [Candidatus Magasanikbacteria bacterium]
MSLQSLQILQSKIQSTTKLLKLGEMKKKMAQLAEEMNQPDFWKHQENAQRISQDYQDIKGEVDKWGELEKQTNELIELEASDDASFAADIAKQTEELEKKFTDYEFFLLLNGPYDKNNAIISIHAGSGGTEAQDWAEMLLRMVFRFCEKQGWKTRIVDESRGAEAGYKSITFEVSGRYAYGYLKSEHGVHRLVRISPFDAEKMRHTSFALIEVLPEVADEAAVTIDPKDLRIDTFMSGGKGGQSVNTTYSAVRIVHIPTGITVQCQNERSQMQNKDMALKILKSRLHLLQEEKRTRERLELRGEYKSAEWGNQIRSYVLHPYHMVNDHRTEYKSTDPESVLEGELLPLSEAYLRWRKK